ncbi:VOC family protein [Actinomycetospora lemnae]|uniref:VOC family protein n=1 Tax=Actinomycetospora lemnae TaxID=3019891 RepID=UPI0038CC0103
MSAAEKSSLISEEERQRLTAARDRIREEFLFSREHRPPSTGKGIHHTALICRDVRTTVEFYQNVAGFPVTVLFENRDLAGSTHFFFDVGNGNCLAFFDLPGVEPGPYDEVLGGLHHIAICVPGTQWYGIKSRLDERGIEYMVESQVSIYTRDPDGARVEFIMDPLGEMYGEDTV